MYRSIWFNDPGLAEREPEAALAYLQSVAAAYTLRTQRALDEFQTMPRAWREVFEMSDWPLRLTPAEAESLQTELRDVIARYRTDTPDANTPGEAERVSVILHVLPELDAPRPGRTSDTDPS